MTTLEMYFRGQSILLSEKGEPPLADQEIQQLVAIASEKAPALESWSKVEKFFEDRRAKNKPVTIQATAEPDKIQSTERQGWISVKDALPPMFEDVIVWGVRNQNNICAQAYHARRWTNDLRNESFFQWLEPCDYEVRDVTHWMTMPSLPTAPSDLEAFEKWWAARCANPSAFKNSAVGLAWDVWQAAKSDGRPKTM